MSNFKSLAIFIPLTFTFLSYPGEPEVGTGCDTVDLRLEEALCLMLEHEPELNAAEYDTLSALADRRIARAEQRPQIALDTNFGYSNRDRTTDGLINTGESVIQRELRLSLRQLLYDGGFARNNVYASRNAHLAQQLTEKSLVESRVVDLSEVYMEVIRVRRQIALAQRNVDNHRAMRDMLLERAKSGGRRSDVGLVQGRLQLAIDTLSTQRLALGNANARFERLVGVSPGRLTPPPIPKLPPSISSIDVSRNFNYLASIEALEAAEHRYLATKARQAPRFYLDAGVSRGENTSGIRGSDNSSSALIVGTFDLSTGGRNRALECREHFQVGKYEELVRAAREESEYLLKLLWEERIGSINSVEALDRYVIELAQVNEDYDEQFKIGQQDLLNILDIQQEFYTAKSRLLDAEFNRDQSVFRILGVQGRLTSHLLRRDPDDLFCKSPVTEDGANCPPKDRLPVTQDQLMSGKFDGNGPIVEMCPSAREAYYIDGKQEDPTLGEKGNCEACDRARSIGFNECDDCGQPRKGIFRRLGPRKR